MPTINLMDKYADKLELKMNRESKVFGKAKGGYDWSGVNKVKSITPKTQTPNDYNPEATGSRFGTLAEVEDVGHEYTLQYSKSNNMSIDKTYNTTQKMLKRASQILKYQINQEYVPMMDKHALEQYVAADGIATATDGALDASTVSAKLIAARKSFKNTHTYGNGKDLVCWVGTSGYEQMLLNPHFLSLEKLGPKALVEGAVGKLGAFQIIEVEDDVMPENVNFVCANLNVLMNVRKFTTLRILTEHPDVDGSVLQPHFVYGAFVNETNAKGVYVSYINAPAPKPSTQSV